MNRDNLITIPFKRELVFFLAIMALAVIARMLYPGADPPHGITFSQGIETDPPQYTIYAKNDVQQGEWNPYQDNRYITYQYSLMSAVSRLTYGLLGVGTVQCDLTASILSLLSMILFYLVLRKCCGNTAALLMLLFIAINYLHIFFGRRPFLEVGMNFLFIVGLYCLAIWEHKNTGHFLWGLFTAGSIFFGKIIGIAFLFSPAVYYVYRIFYLHDKDAWRHVLFMAMGFIVCAGIWYGVVFVPNSSAVTGYVGEQAFGLYGLPEGLQSISKFIWKFVVFAKDSGFFDRMPGISIGAVISLMILTGLIFRKPSVQQSQRLKNTILIAIAGWLIGIYLAQMPLTYQPIRYQISMVFPLGALCAAGIVYFIGKKQFNILNRSLTYLGIMLILLIVPVFQLAGAIVGKFGLKFPFSTYFPFVLGIVGPLLIIAYVISRRKESLVINIPMFARFWLIGLMLLVSLVYNVRNYVSWAQTPLYTTRQAAVDLSMIVSPDAVISGPFGPALTLDNSLGCVIHIFGTSRPDSLLFKKYPITHLALERSNEEVARELYPDIMTKAKKVTSYYINCRKITLYRIAYITGNSEADKYFPSVFEQAMMFYDQGIVDSADFYLDRFQRIYPGNISGNKQSAFKDLVLGNYDSALEAAQNARQFSPTDFSLHYMVNKAYIAKAEETGDQSFKDMAQEARKIATRYNLGYINFDDEYSKDNSKEDEDIDESGSGGE